MNLPFTTEDFVRESNRIEGIHRDPTKAEVKMTADFVRVERVTVSHIVALVEVYQPNARPRFMQGLDVRVGNHFPPRGGPHIAATLQTLLDEVNADHLTPFAAHIQYEMLHPFTDGNGRSGRALWLRHMGGIFCAPLGFLHHFYYQSLQAAQRS